MSDNSNIFRSAVMGGFNRQDVLTYIESRARTHTEELNELGRRLDQSQKELSEAREQLTRSNDALKEAQGAWENRREEIDRMNLELEKLRAENQELSASSSAKAEELSAIRIERDQLSSKVGEMCAQLEDIEQAKLRVANIELEAYARAKKIEDAAIQNTNMARSALANLFQDAKRRFDQTKEDASLTVLRISQELDRLKEVLRHLPGSFDAISNDIEALKFGNEKKNAALSETKAVDEMQYESLVYPEAEQTTPDDEPTYQDAEPTDDEDLPYIEIITEDEEALITFESADIDEPAYESEDFETAARTEDQ